MHHRAIFISDFHLGSHLTKADNLLDFLAHNTADTIYLAGDIVDITRLRRRYYWPESHREIVRLLIARGRAGARIVYVPGNHDPDLRGRAGVRRSLGNIEITARCVHETLTGKRLLVVHGDEHENDRRQAPATMRLGIVTYLLGLKLSDRITSLRRRLGLGYWSLSARVKDVALYRIELARAFRQNLVAAARESGCDGVVAGHIHHSAIQEIDGILYCNDGDWVESCTALVEDQEGGLRLLRWRGYRGRRTPVGAFSAARRRATGTVDGAAQG